MMTKTVSCLLVGSLSFSVGCYTGVTVKKEELPKSVGESDIIVHTRDSLEYRFSGENYRVHGDTLSGYGIRRGRVLVEEALVASLPFAAVDSLEVQKFDAGRTILLCGGIGIGAALIAIMAFGRHSDFQGVSIAPAHVTP